MAKKQEIQKIAPSRCMESLQGFNEAVFFLMQQMETIVQYLEETPSDNQPLKDHIIKITKQHTERVNSFYVYE